MKRFVYRALVALMFLSLTGMGMGCNRTVDNTDDSNKNDLAAGEDGVLDQDTTVDPGDDTTTPGQDVTIPEGCGTVGLTVHDMQTREEGLNCEQPAEGENGFINLDQSAELNCLIVTAQLHDATETLDAFYAADVGGGEYSGIKIVLPKGTAPALAIGDVVSMVGDLKEYYCLTEFEPIGVKDPFGNIGAPVATLITAETLNADPEKWEGVLVKFEGVKVESLDDYGGFKIEGGIIVDDMIFADLAPLEEGCVYSELVGVIEFGYGMYKLLPRNAGDLVAASGDCEVVQPSTTTIADIQDSETSKTCNDEAFVEGGAVSLEGLIVATPRYSVSDDKLHGFFAAAPPAESFGKYSGVLIVTDWADDVNLEVGAEFDLEADWTEYYCLTELNATKITETGKNLAEQLDTTLVDGAQIGEDYEGCLVELLGPLSVEEAVNQYGEIMMSQGVIIKLKFDGVEWDPNVGDEIQTVIGPVDYGYGKYMVMPVSNDDIVK